MRTIIGTIALLAGMMGISAEVAAAGESDASVAGNSGSPIILQKPLLLTGEVITIAGTGEHGIADGEGTRAQFNGPYGITTDGTHLYVADNGSHRIRKIVIANGEVSTIAGTREPGFFDGAGEKAQFYLPYDITTDGKDLFVADLYHRIRKIIIATGEVSTLAGIAGKKDEEGVVVGGFADGTPETAQFNCPNSITTDGNNLYIADTGNYRIRKVVIATGNVSTIAGAGEPGFADGTGVTAKFNGPRGITTDGPNLYIADTGNNRIRKIVIASGEVTTIAGTGDPRFADGAGTRAQFNWPNGITTDGTNLFVVDTRNHRIRKIVIATGMVSTIAGSSNNWQGGFADGAGATAQFKWPHNIATDGKNLYITDTGNERIRIIIGDNKSGGAPAQTGK